MNNNILQELWTNPQRDKVFSQRGEENIISDSRNTNCKWVNYKGYRFYLVKIKTKEQLSPELDYIFNYNFESNPDPIIERNINTILLPSKFA